MLFHICQYFFGTIIILVPLIYFAFLKKILSIQKICPVPFLFICHKHLPCLSGFRYAWNDNIIRLSAIYRQLHENGSIKKGDVSESTVNRYINLLALKLKTTSNQDMRRYERPHINEVWCGDSSIGPYLKTPDGKIKFFHSGLLSAKLCQHYQSSPYSSIASSTPSA